MGIGGSIFLIAVGAIIAFGVTNQNLGPFDLTVIGWVLMLAGVAGLVITLWVWNSRRRQVVAVSPTQQVVQAPPRGETVRRETVAEENWTQPPPERHYQ
jgi:hypothetical protein